MLTFPQEEFEVDLDTPTESKSGSDVVEKQYVSYQDLKLLDGEVVTTTSFKRTPVYSTISSHLKYIQGEYSKSYPVIDPFMSLISEYDFDNSETSLPKRALYSICNVLFICQIF